MTHSYSTTLSWQGSTGAGYRAYSRAHTASAEPAAATLELSADRAFRGDPALLNPEQLLVMAASSCQLLSFLAVAARHGVDVLGYEDSAEGVMEESAGPMRISRIVLRPVITVSPWTDTDEVLRLVHLAHEECYIVNSLVATVEIEPRIEM
jgi:organic hydroperoxide reductase OsmC/OhrA